MTHPAPDPDSGTTAPSMFRPVDVVAPPDGRMVKRGGMALVGVVLQGAVRFLASFLVGRLTSPASLAVVSSGMSLANILALTWPTSTGGAASRFIARARGEGGQGGPDAIARHLGTRTLQSVAVLALLALPGWFLIGGTWREAPIIALLVAGYSGYAFTRGVHFGSGQANRQVKWDLLTSSLAITGVLTVLLLGASPIYVLLPLGGAYLIYTCACWPWKARGRVPRETRREIDGFVAWASLGTLASAGFVQFAMVAAVVIGGRSEAGMFAAAMALAAPAAMIANSLSMVLFPSMAEALGRGDRGSMEAQLNRSTALLGVLVVSIFGVLVVGARPLVHVVWGDAYAGTAALIPALLVPGLLRSLAAPSQGAISTASRGGVVYSSLASVLGFAVGGLIWFLMPRAWGVEGVALGYAVGTSVIAIAIYIKAWRDHHQAWWGSSARWVVSAMAMIGLNLLLQRLELPLVYDAAVAVCFVGCWAIWARDEALVVARLLLRKPGVSS